MRTVICFGELKQAALYFDRVLPVAFRRLRGTGDDVLLYFPEEIPADALSNIVFGADDLSQYERGGRVLRFVEDWAAFQRSVRPYRPWPTPSSSVEDDYEDLRTAYLENRNIGGLGSVRRHFHAFAQKVGLEYQDVLLPFSPGAVASSDDTVPVLTLAGLDLIDATHATWEQIVEIRGDPEAQRSLMRLRAFLSQNYTGRSRNFVEDDLGRRLDEYERTRRKFGFTTLTSAISVLLDSKSLLGAASAAVGTGLLGGPAAAAIAAAAVEVGKVSLEIAKKRREMVDWEKGHELAYILEAASLADKGPQAN